MTLNALAVVHCVDLSGRDLDKRLSMVVSTVPEQVEIVATIARAHRRSTALAGRVKLQAVTDGGRGLVERAVAAGRPVVTVPTTVDLRLGWWENLEARMDPERGVGVVVAGHEGLFAFPAGIGSVHAKRVHWPSVSGVDIVTGASPVGRQTLSAVLIVKDEEEVLPACLNALTGLVDEVVVYDTGSSDDTRQIADSSGALVVEGFWDDDFGAARNRALAHATSEWVLSVDADEIAAADPDSLRSWIDAAHAAGVTMALVEQVSTSWDGARTGFDVRVVRLFRRQFAQWRGAIHEIVETIDGTPHWLSAELAPVRLMHSGYRVARAEEKSKGERNAAIALAATQRAELGSAEWAAATSHHGRSMALSGQPREALRVLTTLLDHEVAPKDFIPAARTAVNLLLTGTDVAQVVRCAGPWIERAEAAGETAGQVALWRASRCMAEGDWWGAADHLAGFDVMDSDGGRDIWGVPFDPVLGVTAMAVIDVQLGSPHAALLKMQSVLHAAPDRVRIVPLFEAVLAAGLTFRDLVREAPPSFIDRSLRDVPQEAPTASLAWFTALADEMPGDFRPVVAASIIAARTGVPEALQWSVRAREAGVQGVCSLRMLAGDAEVPAAARLLAWAVLLHGFGEIDAGAGVMAMLAVVTPEERATVLENLRLAVPDVVDLTLSTAASTLTGGE